MTAAHPSFPDRAHGRACECGIGTSGEHADERVGSGAPNVLTSVSEISDLPPDLRAKSLTIRSLRWNDAFSRVATILSALSAAVVALALGLGRSGCAIPQRGSQDLMIDAGTCSMSLSMRTSEYRPEATSDWRT
jgi:hypothetical protein